MAEVAASQRSGLQLQIAALDRAIDSLVFRLYGLSDSDAALLSHSDDSHA